MRSSRVALAVLSNTDVVLELLAERVGLRWSSVRAPRRAPPSPPRPPLTLFRTNSLPTPRPPAR